ncbi:MAG: tetratricopeptide repeat protein [Planctomycetes bacterium]|nr:tetratricopeptide repeat protein [Planctomycetota bacterium]
MMDQGFLERSIFEAAIDKGSPQERAAYLDQACGSNAALRREVEALLAAHDRLGRFPPAAGAPSPVATVAEPLTERPGTVIGPYKLLEQIGEGGMGLVFVAEQQQPIRRKVALKVIKPGMDSSQVIARFEAERQALALMDHPNIAHVFDGGETASSRPFFVMELVKGVPLTDFCDQNRLPVRERLGLFISVCQAVQHAHQKGIIHRDLKPSNVLVTLHDTVPVVKVIDFGIAKATGQQLTDKTLNTGFAQMVGTPLYMSPEQAGLSGLDVDTRSDIYSLGVLLYELLTGTTPFDKDRFKDAGYDELRRIIREEEPPKPSTRISTLGQAAGTVSTQRQSDPKRLGQLFRGELDWIVMKALEKDRNRRYETATAFAADVQRYLNDEAVQACPPSAAYRLRKFVRRNKGPVLAASLVLLAVLGGIIGSTIGLIRAERARQREEAQRIEAQAQAELARKNEKTANEREALAIAVLDFIDKKIFAAARPEGEEGGLGHDVMLRKAVEAAMPFVEKSFKDEPLIEARLRMTLGISFTYLGEAKSAAEQFERARTLFTKHLGPDHPNTVASMNNLGRSYDLLGRHAEALKLHEQTLALWKAKLGPDDRETLSSMVNLANSYEGLGRHPEALNLRQEVLASSKCKFGIDHPETLRNMNNLANSYEAVGRNADALKLREETLALRKAKLGPDHPDTLWSMNGLAWLLATSPDAKFRDPKRALELAKKAVELAPNSSLPKDGAIWNTLGVCYYRSGKFKASIEALEKSMNLRKGGDSFDWFFLAMACWQLGRKEEGRQWYDKGVVWMDKNQPRNDQLRRFRAEAAEVLGIQEPPPKQERPTERR